MRVGVVVSEIGVYAHEEERPGHVSISFANPLLCKIAMKGQS